MPEPRATAPCDLSRGDQLLHVFVLVALAVAMPLSELLRRFPEFLWAHELGAGALLGLIALLLFVVPLPLVALVLVQRAIGPAVGPLAWAALGLPAAVMALQGLVRAGATGWSAVLIALAAAIAASMLYWRWRGLRRYVGLLLLVALVAPVRLLLSSSTLEAGGVNGENLELGRSGNLAPIVFVIFDELPMISLLADIESWDARNFPSFARLASTAHAFVQASSISAATLVAVPAILIGEEPQSRRAPTLENFPLSLFTAFGGDHRIWAVEPATEMCPDALNRWSTVDVELSWPALMSDLWVLWQSVTLPTPWVEELPETGSAWRDFATGREASSRAPIEPSGSVESSPKGKGRRHDRFHLHYDRLRRDVKAAQATRGTEFRRFIATIGSSRSRTGTPELHFLHTMLPHGPWIYLPSGARYLLGKGSRIGGRGATWSEQHEVVALAYQRHLLQASYADRLLGELLDRLEATGRFDRSLIVVTADHGASFQPGQPLRGSDGNNAAEALWVPLLIKAPGQREPEIHRRPVETTSILATVFDLLGVEPPWPLATPSALDAKAAPGRRLPTVGVSAAMDWKKAAFGADLAIDPPLRLNRHIDLIGRAVDSLPVSSRTEIELVRFTPGAVLDVEPESGVLPVWITGSLRLRRRRGPCCDVVFVVNGQIVAVQPTYTSAGGKHEQFQLLLPESALEPGRNELRVFVVGGEAAERRLLVPRQRWER